MFSVGLSNAFGQKILKVEKATDYSTHVIGDTFEGVVFSNKYTPFPSIYDADGQVITKTRLISLSLEEVCLAENLVIVNLNNILKAQPNFSHDIMYIKHNLKKYVRQYFGYSNKKNQRIVIISYLWRDKDLTDGLTVGNKLLIAPTWRKERVLVNDGGNHYWEMHINVDTKKHVMFGVNGVG